MRHTYKALLALALAASTGAIPVLPQQLLGGIVGTVTDPTGAAVVGASVTVKNVDTNLLIKVATDGWKSARLRLRSR